MFLWFTPFLVMFVCKGDLTSKAAADSQQSLTMALDKRLAGAVRGTNLKKLKRLLEQKWVVLTIVLGVGTTWFLTETFFWCVFFSLVGSKTIFKTRHLGFILLQRIMNP